MGRFCTACGKEIIEGMAFCVYCGTKVARIGEPGASTGQNDVSVGAAAAASPQRSSADFAIPPLDRVEVDTESDIATTEVWQIPVERTPNHADPFTVEMPKDEADAFREKGGFSKDLFPKLAGKSSASEESVSVRLTSIETEDYDESPTDVVFLPIEADEDESPTIVVMREKYALVRVRDGQCVEIIPPCVLGRGKAADKKVRGNQAISRKHAKVFIEDGIVMVQDLGSTNGTFVDGVELEEDQCVPLPDGSVLRLGTEDFTFRVESR